VIDRDEAAFADAATRVRLLELADSVRRDSLDLRRAMKRTRRLEPARVALQLGIVALRLLSAGAKLDDELYPAYVELTRFVARKEKP